MSSIVFVPIKHHSQRVPGKNYVPVNGVPLYQIFPSTLLEADCFNRVVIDTDSEEIATWARSKGIDVVARLPHLAEDTANGNSLLRHHVATHPGYDHYWQGFVTAPFITAATVRRMARNLHSAIVFDSLLSVEELWGHFWTHMATPVNHRPELMPRTQDTPPVYREVCGLFGVTAAGFATSGTRAGARPMLYKLPPAEVLDIDWPADVPQAGGGGVQPPAPGAQGNGGPTR